MNLDELVAFLLAWGRAHPGGTKRALVEALTAQSDLRLNKALLVGAQCVLRINQMQEAGSDANTVAAFHKLRQYDDRPIVVCLLTADGMRLLLANTTFLAQVSDSSYRLSVTHVAGSILSTDIVAEHGGLANAPENFGELWERHAASDPVANLARIVTVTHAMHARSAALEPDRVRHRVVRPQPGAGLE